MDMPTYKQVISRVTYNTATAELIGWLYDESNIGSDYEGIKRHLMLNCDGRFFMLNLFGTMTSRPISQIVSISVEDALHWCEKNGMDLQRWLTVSPVRGVA